MLPERFWQKVRKQNGCWQWLASKDASGYGRFAVGGGKYDRAHRLVWRAAHGEIPEGMCVMHACDNPSCCNPDHLIIGTHQQNMADRDAKGRNAKGEKIHKAKADPNLVERIRSYPRSMSQYAIAKDVGLAPSTIWYIRNNRTWRHV